MPFEIITEQEATQLVTLANGSRIDIESLKNLIKIINFGVHGANGWLDKLKSRAEGVKDSQSRAVLLKGLLRYIVIAKALQQDPAGGLTVDLFPKEWEEFIEKHGNFLGIKKIEIEKDAAERKVEDSSRFAVERKNMSYRRFWDDYLYNSIVVYIKDLINKNESANNRYAKPIIFIFAKLRYLLRDKKLFSTTSTLDKLEKDLIKKAQILKTKAGLLDVFCLSTEEVAWVHSERNFIITRIKEMLTLRDQFESNPLFARYVHVHPEVLVQFCQLFDYSIQFIEKIPKEGVFKKTIPMNEIALLELLKKKREEFAVVMAFQDTLAMNYGCEDFIQTLQSFLQNKEPEFLPTPLFYHFVESNPIAITSFDNDPDAPKMLIKEEMIDWKTKCPWLMKAKAVVLPALTTCPKKEVWLRPQLDSKPLCEEQHVVYVQNLNALEVNLPEFAISALFTPKYIVCTSTTEKGSFNLVTKGLFAKHESISKTLADTPASINDTNEVFKFFVTQQQQRRDCKQCLAGFKEALLLNTNRISAQYDYFPSLFLKSQEEPDINKKHQDEFLSRVDDLMVKKTNFEIFIDKEYELLKNALTKPMNLEEKQVFMAYRNALDKANMDCGILLKKLVSRWEGELKKYLILKGEDIKRFKVYMDVLLGQRSKDVCVSLGIEDRIVP